jgi:predicted transcriptional regulator of viral defense system
MKEEKTTLKRLKLLPNLFRKQDAEKVAPHTAVFLSRALKDGLIYHINRGNYINSFLYGFPAVEDVACFLKPPAYITCEWALNIHGISLQAPVVCTVVTLSTSVGKKRNIQYQGITIEFSKISDRLFFGFIKYDNYYLATPEKAILDTLYYRRMIPAFDELDIDDVDYKTLVKMTAKFPSTVSQMAHKLMNTRPIVIQG